MRIVCPAVLTLLTLVACTEPAQPTGEVTMTSAASLDQLGEHGVIYVPAYSHVYHGSQQIQRFQLAITLSVHNTSFRDSIRIHKIYFYNSDGHLERSFLDNAIDLRPMQTHKVQLAHKDAAGSGANFLIEWEGGAHATRPLAEAVHVGVSSTVGLSFVTRGEHVAPVDTIAGLPE